MDVPVEVQIADAAPSDDQAAWDQINECSIHIQSGRLVVAGCTDYFPDAARIELPAGWYRARVYYAGLDTLSADGLDGADHYRIVLWPLPGAPATVLKNRLTGSA